MGTHLIPACVDGGLTPLASAGVMAVMGVFNLTGALASGWLSDRFDSRWLLVGYFVSRAFALAWLPFSFDSPVGFGSSWGSTGSTGWRRFRRWCGCAPGISAPRAAG